MQSRKLLFLFLLTSQLAFASANSNFGVSYSHSVISVDPPNVRGYRIAAWYQPSSLIWEHFHILFDASFGNWYASGTAVNKSLDVYSISPILRMYFFNNKYASPFFNFSIGLAYLTQTHIDGHNLGMHFSFQDQVGFGATFGQKQQFSIVANALHYSNGSLCKRNAGFSIPLMLSAEYGFG